MISNYIINSTLFIAWIISGIALNRMAYQFTKMFFDEYSSEAKYSSDIDVFTLVFPIVFILLCLSWWGVTIKSIGF